MPKKQNFFNDVVKKFFTISLRKQKQIELKNKLFILFKNRKVKL